MNSHLDKNCPICLEKLTSSIELTCKHQFHHTCITKWYYGSLPNNKCCPLCRTNILEHAINNHIIKSSRNILSYKILNELDMFIFLSIACSSVAIYNHFFNQSNIIDIISTYVSTGGQIITYHNIKNILWNIHTLVSIILFIYENKRIFNIQNHHYLDYNQASHDIAILVDRA